MKSLPRWLSVFISLFILVCASASHAAVKRGGYFQNDGPAKFTPSNLHLVADAVPKKEAPIAGANRPYRTMGTTYYPVSGNKSYNVVGKASWYGRQFNGRKTASGERYNMFAMTAAHKTLPIPSYARVTNLKNGKSIVVRINDRGPFSKTRVMDLSYAAAFKLGFVKAGSAQVRIERVFPQSSLNTILVKNDQNPLLHVGYSKEELLVKEAASIEQ